MSDNAPVKQTRSSSQTLPPAEAPLTKSPSKALPERQLADYGTPPANWEKSKHYYHYGWPVSNEMMREALRYLPFGPVKNPSAYPGCLAFRLEYVLEFEGINAVLCKSDDFCERKGRSIRLAGKEEKCTQFISIGCTYSNEYFWRRPDPEGLEYLSDLFGESPRWMENSLTKKQFRLWTIS